MDKRLLIVDDDVNLLSGLKRHFRKRFDVVVAPGGQEAIQKVREDDKIAVVVSDMQMPGLSGLETLKEIRKINPDIVRMMLTGNADQQTAVDAVNEGAIFRFFNKPCDHECLAIGVDEAYRQYDLIVAERVLLEKTLAGTIKLLLDLLSFSDPKAFSRTTRVRSWCHKLKPAFDFHNMWKLDVAAMMLPLADLIVPQTIVKKQRMGKPLDEDEQELLGEIPDILRNMLRQIPRLEDIGDIVSFAQRNNNSEQASEGPLEGKLLHILNDLARTTVSTMPEEGAFNILMKNIHRYDVDIFNKVRTGLQDAEVKQFIKMETVSLTLPLLRPGQTLISDITSDDGRMLLASGCILTKAHIAKLKAIARSIGIGCDIAVSRPVTG